MRQRGGTLDLDRSVDEGWQRPHAADWKVLNRAQRLHSVEGVSRNLQLSERIFFSAGFFAH